VIILAVIGASSSTSSPRSRRPARSTRSGSPSKAISTTGSSTTRTAARSINDLYVPVDQVVLLTVKSYDVVHSWVVRSSREIQAIPVARTTSGSKPIVPGTFTGSARVLRLYHEGDHARVPRDVRTAELPRVHERDRASALAARSSRASARRARDAGRGRLRPRTRESIRPDPTTGSHGDRPQRIARTELRGSTSCAPRRTTSRSGARPGRRGRTDR